MKLNTLTHSTRLRYSSRCKVAPDFRLCGSHQRVECVQASYCANYQRAEQARIEGRS